MPSKLPIIKANTTQENINKMKVIANSNKRSVAKELEWLIENHIQNYEKEHGEIDYVAFVDEQMKPLTNALAETLYQSLLKSANKKNVPVKQIWEHYLDREKDKKKSDKDFKTIQSYIEQRIAESE